MAFHTHCALFYNQRDALPLQSPSVALSIRLTVFIDELPCHHLRSAVLRSLADLEYDLDLIYEMGLWTDFGSQLSPSLYGSMQLNPRVETMPLASQSWAFSFMALRLPHKNYQP